MINPLNIIGWPRLQIVLFVSFLCTRSRWPTRVGDRHRRRTHLLHNLENRIPGKKNNFADIYVINVLHIRKILGAVDIKHSIFVYYYCVCYCLKTDQKESILKIGSKRVVFSATMTKT